MFCFLEFPVHLHINLILLFVAFPLEFVVVGVHFLNFSDLCVTQSLLILVQRLLKLTESARNQIIKIRKQSVLALIDFGVN